MALSNQPIIGAKDLVYAVLSEASDVAAGTPTYGTVKALAGLGKISVNPNGNISTLYGDDQLLHVADGIGKIDVNFELADMMPSAYAEVLGHTYANGQITENVADSSPYIAVGFKRTRAGAVSEYFWLYKGKLMKPDLASETKKESINFQSQSFKGLFQPLIANGNWRLRLRSDDVLVPSATLTGFFSTVVLTSAADLGALSCVMGVADTTKLSFTFSKVGGGNVTILTDTFIVGTTALVSKSGSLVAGTGAWTGQGTASAVYTFTPTVAFGTNDVAASVTREIKDSSGVACAPKTTIIAYS